MQQEDLLNLTLECKPVYIYIDKKNRLLKWSFKGKKLEVIEEEDPLNRSSDEGPAYEENDCRIVHVSIRPKNMKEAEAYFAYYVYCFLCQNPNTINNLNSDPALIDYGKELFRSDMLFY